MERSEKTATPFTEARVSVPESRALARFFSSLSETFSEMSRSCPDEFRYDTSTRNARPGGTSGGKSTRKETSSPLRREDSPSVTRWNRDPTAPERGDIADGDCGSQASVASSRKAAPSANGNLVRDTESPWMRTGSMATSSRCLVSVFMGVESQEGSERRKSLGGAAGRADGR